MRPLALTQVRATPLHRSLRRGLAAHILLKIAAFFSLILLHSAYPDEKEAPMALQESHYDSAAHVRTPHPSSPQHAPPPRTGTASRPPRRKQHLARRYRAIIEIASDATVIADSNGHILLVNRLTETLFGYGHEELLGQPVERLLPERFHQAQVQHRADFAAAPLPRLMGASLPLFARRRDGSEFPVAVSLAPLQEGGESLVVASIRDATQLQQVQTANQDLRRLQALTDTALAHLGLDDLLPEVLGRVREVLAVDNVVVLLLDAEGRELRVRAARGLQEEVATGVRVPVGLGFSGRIAASREPLIVDDLSTFPVVDPSLGKLVRSAVGVPLVLGERILGVLHVGTAEAHHFTERDVQLLQQVAERVAIAIERSQLYAHMQAAHAAEQHARRGTEAALARALASETRFQRLEEAGIIGVVTADAERIVDANDAFLRMVGYSRPDLEAGKIRWREMSPPEHAALDDAALQTLQAQGYCPPYEKTCLRKDGSLIPTLVGAALLQRDPLKWTCFILDLTERKQLGQALRQRVAQLEAVMEAVPDSLAVYDRDGHLVLGNSAYRAQVARFISGSPSETVRQRNAQVGGVFDKDGERLPEGQWPQSRVLQGQVLVGTDAVEFVVRTPGCEDATFSVTGAPLRDADGTITGAVCVSRDISERKRLEEVRRWQAQLLDQTHDAMFVWEWGGVITYWNRGAELLYGYSQEEAVGQVSHTLLKTEHPGILTDFGALLEQEGEWTGELVHVTRDGRLVTVLSRHQVLFAPGGGRVVLESSYDITERKRLEREQEESQARELAVREVNRHLDQFFITAAHDIRTPVSTTSGGVQMALLRFMRLQAALAAGSSDVERLLTATHESLVAADESADRLTRIVARLFDVARARTGTLDLRLAPCDLTTLVRDHIALERAAASGRTIHVQVPDQAVIVQADADRLGQVLANYLSNALKYSASHQPVEVRLEVMEGIAVVSVQDHGPGLQCEEQRAVWEMFHRAPGAEVLSGTEGSLGLGLHICKRLIELHPGGGVGVESMVGEGSTFWFRLPLLSAAPAT